MAYLKTTLKGYTHYKGRTGQFNFLLHRLTGLGTVLFLAIHIMDTATVCFFPMLYEHAIAIYRTTLFGLAEVGLVFCVLFHGTNGLRIAIFDWFPRLWRSEIEHKWNLVTLAITLILWLPLTGLMIRNLLIHNFGLFGG